MDQNTDYQVLPAGDVDAREIDLLDLLGFYMSRFPILLIALVIGGLLGGIVTYYLIPNQYTAVSRMYMISASSDSVVNLSDLNIGSSLSNDYVELMKSRPVIEDVISQLGLEYTYEQVAEMIGLSVVSNTRIVKISVTTPDPQLSMDIANQMAWTSRTKLPLIMDAPTPSVAEEAVYPEYASSPSIRKNVLVCGLLFLAAVLAVLTVIYLLDDTIKTSEDVEKEFGVMPLSVIPEGETSGSSAKEDTHKRRSSHSRRKKRKKGD